MKASDFYKRVAKTSKVTTTQMNATSATVETSATSATVETAEVSALVEAENIDTQSSQKSSKKDDNYYFDMLDPKTGMRYNIPLLEKTGSYYQDYVHYMKIKETSPSTFDKIMAWN